MKHEKLKAEKRKVLGKHVKKLRRAGILPANVYGKSIKSESLQVKQEEFDKVYKEAGETGLVDLEFDGKSIPVLIHNVTSNFRGLVLHADFFQVNLKEKVKAMVPLEIVGEPKAVLDKIGILMNILSEIEVEALPEELPEKIDVNVEPLANIDDQITVSDLKIPAGVEVLSDKEQVVSKIGELVTKEAQEQATADAAAAEEAKAESGAEGSETAKGEIPAEGEKPAEGGETPKEETKPQE
jgi:large subunit ribosomal protein L25